MALQMVPVKKFGALIKNCLTPLMRANSLATEEFVFEQLTEQVIIVKLSRYIFTFPYGNSEMLLFNSINGCLIKMDSACFHKGNVLESNLTPADIKVLHEGDYLADDEIIISQLDSLYLSPPDTLMLNIEVTGHCNLSCSYCYQQGWPQRGSIQNDTVEKILTYIEKCTEYLDYKTIKLDFIGGEPFMAVDKMACIFSEVKSICQCKDIKLEAQAESNGTLLNLHNLKWFENLDLSVTLSPPEDHNKYRSYNNGQGSYQQIVSNLTDCRELFAKKSIKLNLRYNVHAANYLLFPSFLAEIRRLGLPVAAVKTAYTAEYEYNAFHNGLSLEQFMAWNSSAAIDALREYDFPVPFFPYASTQRCAAYQPFSCKVFYDGSIGLCNASPYGRSELHIEQIATNPELLNEYYREVKSWTPLQDPACSSCKELLLCGGKTFCMPKPCNYALYDLELFLKNYMTSA